MKYRDSIVIHKIKSYHNIPKKEGRVDRQGVWDPYEHTAVLKMERDFPGGPVVKNLPCNARDTGLIPGQRTPKSHMPEEQLSLQARTTEPEHHSQRVCATAKAPPRGNDGDPARCSEEPTHPNKEVKWVANKNLLYSTGDSAQCQVAAGMGRMDTCTGTAESLCCPPETIPTLLMGYTPI